MRPGTPGFIGARLKEARESRGMAAITLADLLGVSRQAISQYENGTQSPRPEIMERIVKILQLPHHFFRWHAVLNTEAVIFYRSMSAATKTERLRAEKRYLWLKDIVKYLQEFMQFPKVNFPNLNPPDDINKISNQLIEEYAAKVRRFWGLGDSPISNLVLLLENNGAVIVRYELGAETLDAFSELDPSDQTPFIILGSDKGAACRSRFDAAHELGHNILHRNISKKHLNKTYEFKLIEEQAHRFAGAFLLPEKTFCKDFYGPTLDSLRSLKPTWKVSIAAMIKRCEHLGLINDEQVRRLWINYTRRGWRNREPLDDQLLPEEPRLLRRAFELLVSQKVQSYDDILTRLPFSQRDIEEIVGLPEGFLSRPFKPAEIISFPQGGRR